MGRSRRHRRTRCCRHPRAADIAELTRPLTLLDAVRSARHADRTRSEIRAMLGFIKQAAQRKHANKISAQCGHRYPTQPVL